MPRLLMRTLFAFCCAAAFSAHAQLTIEIIGGGATTIPIAIVPFAGESNYPLGVSGIVGADLSRSGLFRPGGSGRGRPRPARAEDVRYGDWTGRGADAVVIGSMTALPMAAPRSASPCSTRSSRRSSPRSATWCRRRSSAPPRIVLPM